MFTISPNNNQNLEQLWPQILEKIQTNKNINKVFECYNQTFLVVTYEKIFKSQLFILQDAKIEPQKFYTTNENTIQIWPQNVIKQSRKYLNNANKCQEKNYQRKKRKDWILETQYKISVDPQYFKDLVIKNQNQELGQLETVWFTQEMKNLRNLSDNSQALKNLALTLQKPEQEHLKNGNIEQFQSQNKQKYLEEENIYSYQNNSSTQQSSSLNFSFIEHQQYQQNQQTSSSDFQQSSEREQQILPQLNQQIQSSLEYIESGNACEQQMPQLNYLQEQLQQQAQQFQQNSLNQSEQKQQQQQLQKQNNPQQIIDRVPKSIKIHCERMNNGRKSRSASEDNIILKSPNKN